MGRWYSRPVLFVSDVERSVRFYVDGLGFLEAWRHVEDEKALVAQVERDGTEFLLSCQWPEKIGHGLVFVSLEKEDISETRSRFDKAGVTVRDGWWGYPLMVVEDPDGNQLYFPCDDESAD